MALKNAKSTFPFMSQVATHFLPRLYTLLPNVSFRSMFHNNMIKKHYKKCRKLTWLWYEFKKPKQWHWKLQQFSSRRQKQNKKSDELLFFFFFDRAMEFKGKGQCQEQCEIRGNFRNRYWTAKNWKLLMFQLKTLFSTSLEIKINFLFRLAECGNKMIFVSSPPTFIAVHSNC